MQYEFLPGDCILAAGFMSYMGPFISTYRDGLVESWKKCVYEEEIPCSQDFSVITFLSDPMTVTEWNIQGLPTDGFSTENGIIVTQGTRWPLLIDPHCQGIKWLKNVAKKLDLKVVDFDLPDYMNVIEHAIQHGKAVLLQNVREKFDASLTAVLNKAMIKQGGQMLFKLGDCVVQYNKNFRLYITTKMGNPHYAPEVTTKTTIVNFAVKQEGLEARLLSTVLRNERPQLQEQKDGLVSAIAAAKRQLLGLEDELLRLFETKYSLLDDLELLITLQNLKTTAAAITEQLSVAETTEVEIDSAREVYRACAERASVLFFVLNDMSQIDPMYQFSLDAYISLLVLSIEKSPACQNLEDRIIALNDYHTYSVYRNTCQGLFERHKLLFSFHLCVQIIKKQVSAAEYNFFLKGSAVNDREDQMHNPCPDWLPGFAWDNITELSKLEGFQGVMSSFVLYQQDWQLWYANKEPENLPLVGEWKEICTDFQSMLFVRALRPDRISFCVRKFIVNNLGHLFVEPAVLDIKAVLEDSTPQTPLIFVLSPGDDPTNAVIQLAHSCEMLANLHIISLGQGQAPIATRFIQQGAAEGQWIFLANCHLLCSWLPKLDKIVDTLQTSEVNKRFRLWLSSSPLPDFPISVLQSGIKMTTEPPKGIRSNLKHLYQSVSEDQFSICKNQNKYHKLLFCLSFFHSVLIERKKFQQLGWNIIYNFSDSDFELSVNLLSIYLDKYVEIPWDALKYLIAGVIYGGHVTDDWDRRLLTTYVNQYFCEATLQISLYRLSSSSAYYVPQDDSLQSYTDYITILPTVDQPEVFGQHCNADITSLITESRVLCETLISIEVQHSALEGESREEKVMQLAAEVLSKIPKPIDYKKAEKLIGADKKPLDIVLLQEIVHYNTLLAEIHTSLLDLQRGIKGLVVMSFELEHIFLCIYEGRVPAAWLKAYPSLKKLGSWTQDLVLRVQYFSDWAATTHPLLLFWLSAYTFPTRFLTAVLQTAAKHLNVSVHSLCWEFTVLTVDENAIVELPQDGVYIRGLFLEGATWDKENVCLTEPQPMQLVCSMPVIHFKPVKRGKKEKTKDKYMCPCYYCPQRCGTQGTQAFVLAVELRSGKANSDFWIKRGTALLLSLSD